jgi:hypothetical protein
MVDSKKPGDKSKVFSIDSDSSQMIDVPSITKLLNRKSFQQQKSNPTGADPTAPPPAPAPESTPQQPVLKQSKVQPAGRRSSQTPAKQIVIWEPHALTSATDPLAKAISVLLKKGVTSVLFLSIKTGGATQIPSFESSAAVQPGHRLGLWTGLSWEPTVVPELWNDLLNSGYSELGPPGNLTNQKSNRNVVRAAFGISGQEWFLIVKVGPPHACRGVIGFISDGSIVGALAGVMSLITAPLPVAKS